MLSRGSWIWMIVGFFVFLNQTILFPLYIKKAANHVKVIKITMIIQLITTSLVYPIQVSDLLVLEVLNLVVRLSNSYTFYAVIYLMIDKRSEAEDKGRVFAIILSVANQAYLLVTV